MIEPSIEALQNAWTKHWNGQNFVGEYKRFERNKGKFLIFVKVNK